MILFVLGIMLTLGINQIIFGLLAVTCKEPEVNLLGWALIGFGIIFEILSSITFMLAIKLLS